jgi:hypothetical protein
MPPICIITGKEATEEHIITGFRIVGIPFVTNIPELEMGRVMMPFSAEGWKRYNEKMPISLKLFKEGMRALFPLPFIGILLVILWGFLAAPICGFIAIYDLLMHKKQLVKLHGLKSNEKGMVAINVSVMQNHFAEEFVRLNENLPLPVYKEKHAKEQKKKLLLLLVLFALIAVLIIMATSNIANMAKKS